MINPFFFFDIIGRAQHVPKSRRTLGDPFKIKYSRGEKRPSGEVNGVQVLSFRRLTPGSRRLLLALMLKEQ